MIKRHLYFNPRPREEGDSAKLVQIAQRRISIHALVKRATITGTFGNYNAVISIHALVKRATLPTDSIFNSRLFQSTPS